MKSGVRGFTLIELLIVVVIIGLLAIIALPKFGSARSKAYRAQMVTDLRGLVTAQEAYFEGTADYATDLADLDFNRNPNVTITINDASPRGWSAKATHASITNQCGIYMGSGITPPAGLTLTEAVISCN